MRQATIDEVKSSALPCCITCCRPIAYPFDGHCALCGCFISHPIAFRLVSIAYSCISSSPGAVVYAIQLSIDLSVRRFKLEFQAKAGQATGTEIVYFRLREVFKKRSQCLPSAVADRCAFWMHTGTVGFASTPQTRKRIFGPSTRHGGRRSS